MSDDRPDPSDRPPAPQISHGSVHVAAPRRIRSFADLFVGGSALNDAYTRLGWLIANFAHVEATLKYIHWNLFVADLRLAASGGAAGPGATIEQIESFLAPYRTSEEWKTKYVSATARVGKITNALKERRIADALAAAGYGEAKSEWLDLRRRGVELTKRRNDVAHKSVAIAFLATGPSPVRTQDPFGPSEPIRPGEENALSGAFGAFDQDLRSFGAKLCDRLPADECYRMF
jgi:hypothetical protein